jgi:hypothetical protein
MPGAPLKEENMKVTIDISRPIDKVIELFIDKGNFKEWKKDFVRYEPVSGIPGQVGAVTRIVGKRSIMLETVLSNDVPAEIVEQYAHKRGDQNICGKQGRVSLVTAAYTYW